MCVRDDRSQARLVQIADRGFPRPDTLLCLLLLSSADVYRQVVGIVFALPKGKVKHELALCCGLEPEIAKLQVEDFALVEKVNHPSAVKCVASQSIRVPSNNPVGL